VCSSDLSASPDTVSNQSQDPAVAWWLRAVEQATLRALELAGKRLVGSLPREHRHRDSPMRQVPAWEIHTQASALTTEQINRFLDGAYDIAKVNFGADECVLDTIQEYCQDLLRSVIPHGRVYLVSALARSGFHPVSGECMAIFDSRATQDQADDTLHQALVEAFEEYFTQAQEAILGPGAVTAVATPGGPPSLDAWPGMGLWDDL